MSLLPKCLALGLAPALYLANSFQLPLVKQSHPKKLELLLLPNQVMVD